MRNNVISVRVDQTVKLAVEGLAHQEGRSISSYIERLLRTHLRKKGIVVD